MIFCVFLVCLAGAYTNGACPVVIFAYRFSASGLRVNEREGKGLGGFLLHCTNFEINKEPMHSKGTFGFVLFTS